VITLRPSAITLGFGCSARTEGRFLKHTGVTKDSDPYPNTSESLRDGHRGNSVILNVRINKTEIDLLDRLLKCALVVTGAGVDSQEKSEEVYYRFKERICHIAKEWPEPESCTQK